MSIPIGKQLILRTAAIAVFAAAMPLAAQDDAPPNLQQAIESKQETIDKCLQDVSSADDDVRLRAIMILGKYDSPEAIDAVAASLADPVERIRHNAAVAMSEKRYLPSTAKTAMLRRLDDPSQHVRRVVSSHIAYLLPGSSQGLSMVFVNGASRRVGNGFEPPLSQDLRVKLMKAFRDEDAIVRKNMVDKYPNLRNYVDVAAILPLLRDPDRDVRSLTLDAIQNSLSASALAEHAAHLAEDEDPVIRLRAAEVFAASNTSESAALLDKLAKDEDFQVATEALLALHVMRRRDGREALMARLEDPRLTEASASRIIVFLPTSNNNARAELLQLLEHRRSAYRQAALSSLRRQNQPIPQDKLGALLRDSNAAVRREATYAMMRDADLTADFFKDQVRNPHVDVRTRIAAQVQVLPTAAAAPILEDLMLDEAREVRVAAVTVIVSRKHPDWADVLAAALDVEDDAFAFQLLRPLSYRKDPAIQNTLTDVLPTLPAQKQKLVQDALTRMAARP